MRHQRYPYKSLAQERAEEFDAARREARYYRKALSLICAAVPPPDDLANFNRDMCRLLMARIEIAQRAMCGEVLEQKSGDATAIDPEARCQESATADHVQVVSVEIAAVRRPNN